MEKHHGDAGQTSVDFLTGMSIFALTIIFVLQFTGGSLVTVGSTSTEKGALADRSAALLVTNESMMSAGEPGVLSESQSENYFAINDYDDIKNDLAIPDRYSYNITVRFANESGDLVEIGGTRLGTEAGTDESNVADIAVVGSKKRVAYMRGDGTNETVVLEVRVW